VAIFDRLTQLAVDRREQLAGLKGKRVQIVITDGEAGGGKESRILVDFSSDDFTVARTPCEGADLTVGMMDADWWLTWKNALNPGKAAMMGKFFLSGDQALFPALTPLLVSESAEGDPPEWDGLKAPPARGKFVPYSTGRPKVPAWKPKLAALPAKLRKITPYKEYLEAKPKEKFYEEMDKIKQDGPLGYFYGIKFPYTLEQIHRYGKEWLTSALHIAGTLGKTNKVTKMEVEPFVGGSMSMKCFLHCEYKEAEEGLHAKLFCKYPFPCESEADRKVRYISRFLLNNDGPELDFARILSAGAPMRCVKYYYGDICLNTATVLLITEKLDLPSHTSDFGPYELEPIPFKSVDYLLDDPFPYYVAMTRNVARLAAWGWNGKLGKDIHTVFPPPEYPTAFFLGSKKRAQEVIVFTKECAPQLFPPGCCDKWFEDSLLETIVEVERAQRDILSFLFEAESYCGFTHENMNTDNAIFWRDEKGKVESGFIDWGRFKRNNMARGLTTGYMCTDMVEFMQERDRDLIKVFVDEFNESGGPTIKFETFWEHYLLSWLLLGLLAVDMPHQIWIGSVYTGPEGWADIKDYKDPRVFRMPNYSNGNLAMLRNFVAYWKGKDLPAFWKKWREANPPKAKKPKAKAK